MTQKKTTSPLAGDSGRHSFTPVHLDLVERLGQVADTLAEKAAARPAAHQRDSRWRAFSRSFVAAALPELPLRRGDG